MSFTIEAQGRRISRDDGAWAPGSDALLVEVVDEAPERPLPLVHPSPIVEVDWADEVWVYLHALDALRDLRPSTVTAPELPVLPPLPDGTIP